LKLSATIARENVVVAVRLPEVPVRVTVYCPIGAAAPEVSVRVLELVAGLIENDPVTPLGSPERERLTAPVNPYWVKILT